MLAAFLYLSLTHYRIMLWWVAPSVHNSFNSWTSVMLLANPLSPLSLYGSCDTALQRPLLHTQTHYLSSKGRFCQRQSCSSMWRTCGHCHRRCQTWTHLQHKDKPLQTTQTLHSHLTALISYNQSLATCKTCTNSTQIASQSQKQG